MIKTILVASDGSKHAHHAAEKALELAKQLGSDVSITLFHVVSKTISRGELIHHNLNIRAMLEGDAHQALMRTELLFKKENIPFDLQVVMGDPAQEITRKANMESYDLVIIGSRGLNKMKELIMGSVSREVAHSVWGPVLIVK